MKRKNLLVKEQILSFYDRCLSAREANICERVACPENVSVYVKRSSYPILNRDYDSNGQLLPGFLDKCISSKVQALCGRTICPSPPPAQPATS